jgi:hypothetical protein
MFEIFLPKIAHKSTDEYKYFLHKKSRICNKKIIAIITTETHLCNLWLLKKQKATHIAQKQAGGYP